VLSRTKRLRVCWRRITPWVEGLLATWRRVLHWDRKFMYILPPLHQGELLIVVQCDEILFLIENALRVIIL
jgi:hypothetical protein